MGYIRQWKGNKLQRAKGKGGGWKGEWGDIWLGKYQGMVEIIV